MARQTRSGSAEGSDAVGEGGFRPISGQKEQVRLRDSGAAALKAHGEQMLSPFHPNNKGAAEQTAAGKGSEQTSYPLVC